MKAILEFIKELISENISPLHQSIRKHYYSFIKVSISSTSTGILRIRLKGAPFS